MQHAEQDLGWGSERFRASSGQEESLVFVSEELDACIAAPLDACGDLVRTGRLCIRSGEAMVASWVWEAPCQVP